MVSTAPNTQSYDFTHVYNNELFPSKQSIDITNTIYEVLSTHPHLNKFTSIVNTANLSTVLSDPQANLTVFAFVNSALDDPFLYNLNRLSARNIVKSYTLQRKIPIELLTYSKDIELSTQHPINKLYVSNVDGVTIVNGAFKLISEFVTGNGIVHVLHKL